MAQTAEASPQAIYEMLMESQRWSADQMLAFQQSQLAQLLRHARAQVPFYKKRLDCLFSESGEILWEKWNEVPVLTRKELAENTQALQALQIPQSHGNTLVASTSGSTGLPVSVTHTRLLSDVCRALDWRAHRNWGFDWSQTLVMWHHYGEKYASKGPDHDYGPWGPKLVGQPAPGRTFVHNTSFTLDELTSRLTGSNAKYLFAQGNVPLNVALNLIARGRSSPLGAVVAHGVQIDDQFHRAMHDAFCAKSYALYSSKEGGRMAHMCHASRNYHVNDESVFLEILDDENQPCEPGKPGRVVVTNFYHSAQPMIRYEQGDVATWAETCSCGKQGPVIKSIDGRIYHLFHKRDGSTFAPLVIDSLRADLDAMFWQFVQIDSGTILVRYKPMTQRSSATENAFIPILQNALGDMFDIRFEVINELPLTSSGKFLKYMNAI
jgi:phenylacetate-CoA ligase